MIKSKKAVVHTWFDYVFAIVGGIIIFIIIFVVASSGTAKVEREIKAQSFDIKSEETLVAYLSTKVGHGPLGDFASNNERFKLAEKIADSGMTFADLIALVVENDNEDYKDILTKRTENTLNYTLGEEKWKLDIQYPDGKEFSMGGFKGETRIFELKLPSTGYKLINIKLTSKKEKT